MPSSDPDCPFCAIVANESPDTREIYRDQAVVAFFPDKPATVGHTLVIPREHFRYVWDLDSETAGKVGIAVARLAGHVVSALSPAGLNVVQSNGAVAEQSVSHVHFHVVPRWPEDPIDPIWPPKEDYPDDLIKRAQATLRDEIAQRP